MQSGVIRFVTMCFATGSFLIGCSATDTGKNTAMHPHPERTVKRTVTDYQGTPFLKIDCEYIGRQPYKDYPSDVPWQTQTIDFYNIVFENLTPHKITFLSKKVYQKDSGYHRTETGIAGLVLTESADFTHQPNSDFDGLEPFEERKLINWSFETNQNPSEHTANIIFQIQYQGRAYTFNIPLVDTRR